MYIVNFHCHGEGGGEKFLLNKSWKSRSKGFTLKSYLLAVTSDRSFQRTREKFHRTLMSEKWAGGKVVRQIASGAPRTRALLYISRLRKEAV